jgi:hypothetical protein
MIKIFQVNDTNPDLLPTQLESFKKHLQEDFEFVVVNGGALTRDQNMSAEVTRVCRTLGVQVIDVQRDDEIEALWRKTINPGEGLFAQNGRFKQGIGGHPFNYLMQWAWQRVVAKETGLIAFVHTDVFLLEPIKFSDYLVDQPLCFVGQSEPNTDTPTAERLFHMWEPLLFADMSKLPDPEQINWFPNRVHGTWMDTGAQTYFYLKQHPDLKYLDIEQSGCVDDPDVDFHPARYQFFHPKVNGVFKKVLHYQSGSKWCTDMPNYWGFTKEQSDTYHAKKLAWARRMIGLEA